MLFRSFKAQVSEIPVQTYTSAEIKPALTVTGASGKKLVEGVDYEVSYSDNIEVGTATALIVGFGDYEGYRTVTFEIEAASIADCVIAPIPDQTVTGQALKPALEVSNASGGRLAAGTDYMAVYHANVEIGTAHVALVGKG